MRNRSFELVPEHPVKGSRERREGYGDAFGIKSRGIESAG